MVARISAHHARHAPVAALVRRAAVDRANEATAVDGHPERNADEGEVNGVAHRIAEQDDPGSGREVRLRRAAGKGQRGEQDRRHPEPACDPALTMCPDVPVMGGVWWTSVARPAQAAA